MLYQGTHASPYQWPMSCSRKLLVGWASAFPIYAASPHPALWTSCFTLCVPDTVVFTDDQVKYRQTKWLDQGHTKSLSEQELEHRSPKPQAGVLTIRSSFLWRLKIHIGCIVALYTASEQLPLEYCAPCRALHYQEDIDWHVGGSSEKSNKNN